MYWFTLSLHKQRKERKYCIPRVRSLFHYGASCKQKHTQLRIMPKSLIVGKLLLVAIYRIVGKFGRQNVWRIYSFKRLAEKSLANE